jgi:hypothetical protein
VTRAGNATPVFATRIRLSRIISTKCLNSYVPAERNVCIKTAGRGKLAPGLKTAKTLGKAIGHYCVWEEF